MVNAVVDATMHEMAKCGAVTPEHAEPAGYVQGGHADQRRDDSHRDVTAPKCTAASSSTSTRLPASLEYYEETADGKIHIHTLSGCGAGDGLLQSPGERGLPDGNFREEGWLYALIPPILQAQLFKKGINFLDPNDTKKVVDE
jgi:hypothetical protein